MAVLFHLTDENAVLREQLEYLIAHTDDQIKGGCPECGRYSRVRAILFEVFAETAKRGKVVDLTKAAGA